jgi:hypothetical protein
MPERSRDGAGVASDIDHHLSGRMSKAMERETNPYLSFGCQLPNELEEPGLKPILGEGPATRADYDLSVSSVGFQRRSYS